MAELKDVKELLQHDYLAKDEAPKAAAKGWGKPPVPQSTAPVKSLLEIEEEQKREKEKLEAEKKPTTYQPKHTPSAGAYARPERSEGPTTSFEAYSREHRPRQHAPIPTHPPFTAYVGNLPFNVTEDQIADFFTGLQVKDIRLVKTSDGRSKGFAFVEFETSGDLTDSLSATGLDFCGRPITIEVQPPRQEKSYGGPSHGDDDKSRWGPSSGIGPASALGSQTQARNFDRPGGSYAPRTTFGTGSRDFDSDERQWRGNPRPEPVHQPPVSQVRPKLELKPRTVTDEIGKPSSSSSGENPFGGAVDQEKLKRQAEIQAQREAETAAKHKLSQQTTPNKSGHKEDRDGFRAQNRTETSGDSWRSNRQQQQQQQAHEEKEQPSGGEKYRFNKGGNAPQRNFDNRDKSSNQPSQSTNTFQSLASGKW